jgi:SAM-dependent methyltransferase
MMSMAVPFDMQIAHIYDETRPIDPEACRACFRDALQCVVGKGDIKIADIGCGTGRILECLIPDLFQKEQIVGVDISPAMLDAAKSKSALRGVEFRNISAVDFAGKPHNQRHFDVVICHWLFHCVPEWRALFRACVDLTKSDGLLAWLEEDGDLYHALDGMSTSNEPLKRLFEAYYRSVNRELRALAMDGIDPFLRTGTALRCTNDLARELAASEWNVQTHFKMHHWTKRVSVTWILSNIFERRVFTNLRRIPLAANARATDDLKQKLGTTGLPKEGDSIELHFWATPAVAIAPSRKKVPVLSGLFRANEQSLQTIYQDV